MQNNGFRIDRNTTDGPMPLLNPISSTDRPVAPTRHLSVCPRRAHITREYESHASRVSSSPLSLPLHNGSVTPPSGRVHPYPTGPLMVNHARVRVRVLGPAHVHSCLARLSWTTQRWTQHRDIPNRIKPYPEQPVRYLSAGAKHTLTHAHTRIHWDV